MEPTAEEEPSGQASHSVENASSEKVFTGQSAQGASPVLEYRPGAQAAAANVHTCINIDWLEGGKGNSPMQNVMFLAPVSSVDFIDGQLLHVIAPSTSL